MQYKQMLEQLTPEIYEQFKRAIEIGKWPDGRKLSDEQKSLCMEAVIAYDIKHHAEIERVGYIDRGSKAEGEMCNDDDPKPIKWS
jgi:hypothetical protein